MILAISDQSAFCRPEIFPVQFKKTVGFGYQYIPYLIQVFGLAVRSQTHHLVFVAVMGETQKLGHCAVKYADTVGKINRAQDLHLISISDTRHSGAEIP